MIEAVPQLQASGCTPEECERLVALRERVRQGCYSDDGPGSVTGDVALDRRLAFVRWLVAQGRLSDFDAPGSDEHAACR